MTAAVQFDAIVVGSGITGGWAAKELTERGLKVLVLERGRDIQHGKDYITEHIAPWQIPYAGRPLRALYKEQYPIQSRVYAFDETTRHFFNNDRDNPYVFDPQRPFYWTRANGVGGRSLLWGKQVYRWSDLDFEANKKDGHGIDWPLRYADIRDWYSHVEKFIGVSGQKEGLPQLPDGEFMPPMPMNAVERTLKKNIEARYPGRRVTIGRCAILTEPKDLRGACHYCGHCERGCSVGAYFSSQSSTLPAARATGNLTLRPDSVVEGLDYDAASRRITGVRVIDANTREKIRYGARLVFLCASTVGSVQVLLNSRSESFPQGLANRSGTLGHYLMDHTDDVIVMGVMPGFESVYPFGARPNISIIPRFRNVNGQDADSDFVRGYYYQLVTVRPDWRTQYARVPGFGADFKHALRTPGPWLTLLNGYGECLPRHDNRVTLHPQKKDRFGIPQVQFHMAFGANEQKLSKDLATQGEAMLRAAGAVNVASIPTGLGPGEQIHEMGGARMGRDPRESVLNAFNQAHDVPNLFVTDGACMTSSSCVNPSITYMALTARAADYAVRQLRAGAI